MTATNTANHNVYAPSAAPTRTLGILSLVGGIASIVFGQTILIPVAAIILGFLSRRQEPGARTFANWGIALSFVGLFGWVVVLFGAALLTLPFLFTGLVFSS
jgi:hypothetical protein